MSITPGSGYVMVSGDIKCFSSCTEVKAEIVVYQETLSNVWQEIWRQSCSAYNTREVYSSSVNVPVGPGRYKVGGETTTLSMAAQNITARSEIQLQSINLKFVSSIATAFYFTP